MTKLKKIARATGWTVATAGCVIGMLAFCMLPAAPAALMSVAGYSVCASGIGTVVGFCAS